VPNLSASLFLVLSAPSLSSASAVRWLEVGSLFLRCCRRVQAADIGLLLSLLTLCHAFNCWAVVASPVSGRFCFMPHRCNV
jgi:hypothetical protein